MAVTLGISRERYEALFGDEKARKAALAKARKRDLARRRERLKGRASRSGIAAPTVMGLMDPVKSMIDGRIYDSKTEYQRHVARNGCEVVGFDDNWQEQIVKPRYDERAHEADIVADVKRAIEETGA